MSREPNSIPAEGAEKRSSFFRQSGWLMIANVLTGGFMWAVHFLSQVTGPDEYGAFVTFLAVAMVIPTVPIQMILAQQTAAKLAIGKESELAGLFRSVWIGTFVIWLVGCVVVLMFQAPILRLWKLNDAGGLWVTLGIVLLCLWLPIFWGVLQGCQRFLWLGWSMVLNGFGRMAFAGLAVWLGARAAGMLTGVLLGLAIAVGIGIWHTRDLWSAPSVPFDKRALLKHAIPLFIGFGTFQFLFTADMMFAKASFDRATVGFYGSAGTMSRALMWLVGPLAAVMFPRLVHNAARAEKSNLMNLVFLGTGVLGLVGATSLSLLGPWLVQIMSGKEFVAVASALLPWYAFAMVPLGLGNVLLNNLMAHSDFRAVPFLALLTVSYGLALGYFNDTPIHMIQTVGVGNLMLLGICGWFTWVSKPGIPSGSAAPADSRAG